LIAIKVVLIGLTLVLYGTIPIAGAQGESSIERVAPGVISTGRNQTFPTVDPAASFIWFSVYDKSFDNQTIMFSQRTESGWSEPNIAPFSGEWGDRAPRLSPDGSVLYFSSNRPITNGGDVGDINIWRTERVGQGWGSPELLESPLNSAANDMHVSVTDEAIWFASNREGGLGRSDIYRVGHDGAIEHPGTPINDEYSQPDLWVSRDESWMILAISNHPDGFGGDDLYISRFDGDAWSVPVNLGPEVNTDEYEYGPSVSPDGEYLYFTSHKGGSADVYAVRLALVLD